MKYRYTVQECYNDTLDVHCWYVYDSVKKLNICEAYERKDAYTITQSLNR